MDGAPVVRKFVNKLYGTDEPMQESVVISEDQVIVSRETLRKLYEVYEAEANLYFANDETVARHNAFLDEVREALGNG